MPNSKIIIDQLPHKNEVTVFDKLELLENSEAIKDFDCRVEPFEKPKYFLYDFL
jgi:hypothetical protein